MLYCFLPPSRLLCSKTLHIRSNFRMDRGIPCIMLQTTYKSSNNGEPTKVSSGMMDRLFFIIILRDEQETEIETKKVKVKVKTKKTKIYFSPSACSIT